MAPKNTGATLPDELRCKRNDGKMWRCSKPRAEGQSFCEHHYNYSVGKTKKNKAMVSKKTEKEDGIEGKSAVKEKDKRKEVKFKAAEGSESEDDGEFEGFEVEKKRCGVWPRNGRKRMRLDFPEESEEEEEELEWRRRVEAGVMGGKSEI